MTDTAIAGQTLSAVTGTAEVLPTLILTSTSTSVPPTSTPVTPTATLPPTFTLVPSLTKRPPTATAIPIPCDSASFVEDVSVPDGSVFSPGASFTKTWRLKNTGRCTWTTNYAIVFDSGEQMGGGSPVAFTNNVVPTGNVDVSVTFTAPSLEGNYRSYWKLRNASGTVFGTGANSLPFYVDIVVKKPTTTYPFDFVYNICNAAWTNGTDTLLCSGATGDADGYVQRIDAPILETGAHDNEPVLLMSPKSVDNGYIRGKFPLYTVVNGDTFRSILGCAQDATTCNVIFELGYTLNGETTYHTLSSWNKTWDGKTLISVVYDLSSLAGKRVAFQLTVTANGAIKDDRAQWLAPRILHK